MELHEQRLKILDQLLETAKKYPRFMAKTTGRKHKINGYTVSVQEIRNSFLLVRVYDQSEVVFAIRHYDSFENTVNMTLNFINLNFLR